MALSARARWALVLLAIGLVALGFSLKYRQSGLQVALGGLGISAFGGILSYSAWRTVLRPGAR